jgi:hypothetical protein
VTAENFLGSSLFSSDYSLFIRDIILFFNYKNAYLCAINVYDIVGQLEGLGECMNTGHQNRLNGDMGCTP